MDEPFGALDGPHGCRMAGLSMETWTGTRNTVMFITHDVDEVRCTSPTRVVVRPPLPAGSNRVILGDLPYPRTEKCPFRRIRGPAARVWNAVYHHPQAPNDHPVKRKLAACAPQPP